MWGLEHGAQKGAHWAALNGYSLSMDDLPQVPGGTCNFAIMVQQDARRQHQGPLPVREIAVRRMYRQLCEMQGIKLSSL